MKKNSILAAILVTRPLHWTKNISVFAAAVFTETLLIPSYFKNTLEAFIIFSLIASSAYIFNDILDAKSDRKHPIKRKRPVASGDLPVIIAVFEGIFLLLLGLFLAKTINPLFFALIFGYSVLQILYSLFLKNLPIIDILVIASGFVMRVYAGAFAINAHLSVWFLLCVISTALFLASGKRRAELNVATEGGGLTRKSLGKYKRELLNSYVTMFGNASWMSWSLFTFFESPTAATPIWVFLAEISKATTINKLLMITIPVVIFGIMRYESLIFEEKSEAPEKVLLTDLPLISSVATWGVMVLVIIYGGFST